MLPTQVLRQQIPETPERVPLNDNEAPRAQATMIRRRRGAGENQFQSGLIGCGLSQGFGGAAPQQGIDSLHGLKRSSLSPTGINYSGPMGTIPAATKVVCVQEGYYARSSHRGC